MLKGIPFDPEIFARLSEFYSVPSCHFGGGHGGP